MTASTDAAAARRELLERRPCRVSSVWKTTPGGGLLVFLYSGYVELNATARAVWALSDGTRTIAEVIARLQADFLGAPRQQIENDVLSFLAGAEQRQMLVQDWDPF